MKKVFGIKECAELYAKKRGIPKSQAEEEFKTAVDVIGDMCVDGGVSFKGMFTISTKVRKGRKGSINGHDYETDDKKVLSISVGKKLDEALNK